jgi:hypothetical protein
MTMADDADLTQAREDREFERAMNSRHPYVMDAGKPGECDFCGEWFGRLVDGACVPCREKYERRKIKR